MKSLADKAPAEGQVKSEDHTAMGNEKAREVATSKY